MAFKISRRDGILSLTIFLEHSIGGMHCTPLRYRSGYCLGARNFLVGMKKRGSRKAVLFVMAGKQCDFNAAKMRVREGRPHGWG
jgi:hypothetical protein